MSRQALLSVDSSRRDLLDYAVCREKGEVPRPILAPRINWETIDLPDEDWPVMTLPTLWQEVGIFKHGTVWFRRRLAIPPEWSGHELALELGRCADAGQVFLNGQPLDLLPLPSGNGSTATPIRCIIPATNFRIGENILAVRVESWREGSGFLGPAEAMFVSGVDEFASGKISLAGEWRYKVETASSMHNVTVQSWLTGPEKGPNVLFDTIISRLLPFSIRGVFWYQGEQNVWQAATYSNLFVTLIRDWRNRWKDPFPFLFVQLPNAKRRVPFPAGSDWAELRESQAAALSEPDTAMAVTIDCGEEDLHPNDKRAVADRLSSLALAIVYGQPLPHRSPVYLRHHLRADSILVEFSVESGPLKTLDNREVRGFAVSGIDQVFVKASAQIIGCSVLIFSACVRNPAAVRYAWENNPDCNLCDSAGLPAAPFRTDSWPRLTGQ